MRNISLIGNPNCGKTTLFNAFTGGRREVGNYPGVTVEKYELFFEHNGNEIALQDLPGTYSLHAYSAEEQVVREVLQQNKVDMLINVVNATSLERSLMLTVELLEMGLPLILSLNMMDEAEKLHLQINSDKLSKLLGIPVVPVVAKNKEGLDTLLDTALSSKKSPYYPLLYYDNDIEFALTEMEYAIHKSEKIIVHSYVSRFLALQFMENQKDIMQQVQNCDEILYTELMRITQDLNAHLDETLNATAEDCIAEYRHGYIVALLKEVLIRPKENFLWRKSLSHKIDKVVTHKFWGVLILFAVLYLAYFLTFTLSDFTAGYLESFFAFLSDFAVSVIPEGHLQSLVVSGIIGGVGSVLSFAPLIFFMFVILAILNDSGYMARVAHILDRIFRAFGLHGSSVMPYIVSGGIAGGCAIPGIMATRCLRSREERLATMLTVGFMACGAKIPVFMLFTSVFFGKQASLVMFSLTLIGWVAALFVSLLLRKTLLKGEPMPFIMELPPYRTPVLKGVFIHAVDRLMEYIKKAATIILAISIIIWAGMTFPTLSSEQEENIKMQVQASPSFQLLNNEKQELFLEGYLAEEALKHSVAGRVGIALEPVGQYAGFDWRVNVSLLAGFAAKEVIISTLATSYSLSADAEDSSSLSEVLATSPDWTSARAWALLLFVLLYAPCFISTVVLKQESGSWKYALIPLVLNTGLAYIVAVVVFNVLK